MNANADMQKRRAPAPSTTRTDRDWVMIGLAALLILFFLVAGWLAFRGKDKGTGRKFRGPVRDPGVSEIVSRDRLAKVFGTHRTVSEWAGKQFRVSLYDFAGKQRSRASRDSPC
jgi:hypothetical protein